ncbi:MAG: putative phenol acid carboxylase [Aureobasidium pullulans]|nr:MAG: putative phenol acid carboxylase [Aureobasidium pullulans]
MPLPLGKTVKARAADEDDCEEFSGDDSSPSVIETGENEGDEILSSSDEDQEDHVKDKLSGISFGTLSRAQESISKKRKRPAGGDDEKEDKLEALRARLRELREASGVETAPKKNKKNKKDKKEEEKSTTKPAAKKSRTTKDDSDDGASDGSDNDSDEDGAPHARSSKHAPMAQASNRQVTRKRQVIDVPKSQIRDPRFNPLGGPVDDTDISKKYSFINDYQDSEMAELKAAIKKTKSEDDKAVLKRKLLSMESKKKARENKEREQEVIREHRKKEKEAIAQGKNPFYLKKSDQKQQALVNKFDSMKSKDRERLIERRRKKVSQREKKNMPAPRRM